MKSNPKQVHLLRKPLGLLLQSLDHALLPVDGLLLHTDSFSQSLILLSQRDHFFLCRHDPTLLGSALACKTLVLLNSYVESFSGKLFLATPVYLVEIKITT